MDRKRVTMGGPLDPGPKDPPPLTLIGSNLICGWNKESHWFEISEKMSLCLLWIKDWIIFGYSLRFVTSQFCPAPAALLWGSKSLMISSVSLIQIYFSKQHIRSVLLVTWHSLPFKYQLIQSFMTWPNNCFLQP